MEKVKRLTSAGSFAGDIVLSLNEGLDSFIETLYDDEMVVLPLWDEVEKNIFKRKEEYAMGHLCPFSEK